jgi:hypothetical protein
VPQCASHYSSAGNAEMLNTVVHQNVGLSEDTVSDILDSDHLPIIFHILDQVRTQNLSDLIKKFTDMEQFQSLASDLVPPGIQFNLGVEANKVAHDFTDSVDLEYRLSTSKVTFWTRKVIYLI